jgi:hypothetical protein
MIEVDVCVCVSKYYTQYAPRCIALDCVLSLVRSKKSTVERKGHWVRFSFGLIPPCKIDVGFDG